MCNFVNGEQKQSPLLLWAPGTMLTYKSVIPYNVAIFLKQTNYVNSKRTEGELMSDNFIKKVTFWWVKCNDTHSQCSSEMTRSILLPSPSPPPPTPHQKGYQVTPNVS